MLLPGPVVTMEYLLLAALLCLVTAVQPETAGRHVCVQRRQVPQATPVRQSYLRHVYKPTVRLCQGYKLCRGYSRHYQVAYRTVYQMRMRVEVVHACCPGWEMADPYDRDCLKPLCKESCFNGGTCTAPDKCACPTGWTGDRCDTDFDECSQPEKNKCQQVCLNAPGSYECGCHDGFTLNEDYTSCKLCLSCLPEYQEMNDMVHSLMDKVTKLEEEKDFLMTNLSVLVSDYQKAMTTVDELRLATPPPSTTTPPYPPYLANSPYLGPPMAPPLERLASLSEQISLLEERLGACACVDYDGGPR